MTLNEKLLEGCDQVLIKKGKGKIILSPDCPEINTYGNAIWNAIMFQTNRLKVIDCHLIFMNDDTKELFDYIYNCTNYMDLSCFAEFDTDGKFLKELNLI